jgi:hypothetical protein
MPQEAKARGKKLGNPRLAEAHKRAFQGNKVAAARYPANVLPVIHETRPKGKSLSAALRGR